MYGLVTYIWVVFGVTVGKYTLHWASAFAFFFHGLQPLNTLTQHGNASGYPDSDSLEWSVTWRIPLGDVENLPPKKGAWTSKTQHCYGTSTIGRCISCSNFQPVRLDLPECKYHLRWVINLFTGLIYKPTHITEIDYLATITSMSNQIPFLVGGVNPVEKYARQIGSFPQGSG